MVNDYYSNVVYKLIPDQSLVGFIIPIQSLKVHVIRYIEDLVLLRLRTIFKWKLH